MGKNKNKERPGVSFLIYMPKELKKRAFKCKEETGFSVAKMVRVSLEAFLDKYEKG